MYASDYRQIARDRLAGHWWLSVGVAFIASALGGAITGSPSFNLNIDAEHLSQLPDAVVMVTMYLASFASTLSLAQFILGGTIAVGNAQYLLNQHDGHPLEFKTLFSKFDQFGATFCMNLLRTIFIALWSLLLIIPGIIAAYSYALAPFLMAENPELKARDALRASKELMQGHKWELFCLDFSFIGWYILCILTLGIGSLFLVPYTSAAHAAFYRSVATPHVL